MTVVTMVAAVASCSLRDLAYLSDVDASKSEVSFGDGAASDGVAGGDGSTNCPSSRGPKMVRVDSFCIDSTEVTERDYTLFLDDKKGDTAGQRAECSWNTSFMPSPDFFPRKPTLPIRTIDWCDAVAYCSWAGKRLCGKIGGGTVPTFSTDDPEIDQWYRACSKAGTRTYPYGDTYDRTACRDETTSAVEVATLPKCEGGYPGIFDMSGNLWEWEDDCDDTGACPMRGGSYEHKDVAVACAYGTTHYAQDRKEFSSDTGFRCCSP